MVELQHNRLDAVFHSLADPTRREMLRRLGAAECTVGELAAPFAMSLAAASKHIQALERAGLVQRTVLGRRHICRIAPDSLSEAQQWISEVRQFWNMRLDMLDELLREEDRAAAAKAKKGRARTTGKPKGRK